MNAKYRLEYQRTSDIESRRETIWGGPDRDVRGQIGRSAADRQRTPWCGESAGSDTLPVELPVGPAGALYAAA